MTNALDLIDPLADVIANENAALYPTGVEREANVCATAIPTIGASELAETVPEIPWLCAGMKLAQGGRVNLIVSDGGVGKTFLVMDWLLDISRGAPLFGIYKTKRARVGHFDWENPRNPIARRYQRLAAGKGFDLRELADGDWLRYASRPESCIDDADATETFKRSFDGFGFVLLDSLVASTRTTDENLAEVGRLLYNLGRASESTGTCVTLLHHLKKPSPGQRVKSKDLIRGSSALSNACDSVFIMSTQDKGAPVAVEHVKNAIDGEFVDDFSFAIEDVQVAGNPKGGLRIRHLSAEQLLTGDELKRHLQLMDRIVRALAKEPGVAGKEALAKRVGARTQDVGSALAELLSSGRVENSGTKQRPKLYLTAGGV